MEFDINGNTYTIGKLSAFEQDAVARRLLPLIPSMVRAWEGLAYMGDPKSMNKTEFIIECGKLGEPFFEAYAKLSDDAVRFIQFKCLSVTKRHIGAGQWAFIFLSDKLVFEDIDAMDMNEIVFKSLKENLTNFFSGLARRGLLPEAFLQALN